MTLGLGALRRRLADFMLARRDTDALYAVLYEKVHDLDRALEVGESSTAAAFGRQWEELPQGEYLLSDPWFEKNVDRIICEQELLLPRDWFAGKKVLDAGCGNGRWTYGLCKLGADVTAVDINLSALAAARDATAKFENRPRFVLTPLENLNQVLQDEQFDLVWCWGVAHHCVRFNAVLDNLARATREHGILYLYLYGRESASIQEEMRLFKDRVAYNVLMNDDARRRFLLKKAKGNEQLVHNMHDIYAPLINRRFEFDDVRSMLAAQGFGDIVRTIDHTEVFVRASRGLDLSRVALPAKQPPYWFQGKQL